MKARTLSHCVDKDRKEIPILQIFSELSRRSFGRGCVPQSGFRTAARKIPGSGKHARTTLWSHTAARRKTPAETAGGNSGRDLAPSRPPQADGHRLRPDERHLPFRGAPSVRRHTARKRKRRTVPTRRHRLRSPAPGPGSGFGHDTPTTTGRNARRSVRMRRPETACGSPGTRGCPPRPPSAWRKCRLGTKPRSAGRFAPRSGTHRSPRHGTAASCRQPETMPEETQESGLLRTCTPNCTRLPKFIFLFVNLYVTLPDKAP